MQPSAQQLTPQLRHACEQQTEACYFCADTGQSSRAGVIPAPNLVHGEGSCTMTSTAALHAGVPLAPWT